MRHRKKRNGPRKEREEKVGSIGTVIEALPNTMFKIVLEDGEETLGFLAGRMRMHRIRVLVGDKVEVTIDPYGGKARIFKRL